MQMRTLIHMLSSTPIIDIVDSYLIDNSVADQERELAERLESAEDIGIATKDRRSAINLLVKFPEDYTVYDGGRGWCVMYQLEDEDDVKRDPREAIEHERICQYDSSSFYCYECCQSCSYECSCLYCSVIGVPSPSCVIASTMSPYCPFCNSLMP